MGSICFSTSFDFSPFFFSPFFFFSGTRVTIAVLGRTFFSAARATLLSGFFVTDEAHCITRRTAFSADKPASGSDPRRLCTVAGLSMEGFWAAESNEPRREMLV